MRPKKAQQLFIKFFILALAALLSYSIAYGSFRLKDDNLIHLKFFIKTVHGSYILVDGGPDSRVLNFIVKDIKPGPCYLDLVVLTHPHSDHLYGLNEVLKYCRVGVVLTTEIKAETKVFGKWEELLREATSSGRVKEVSLARSNNDIQLDGILFDVLWPLNESVSEVENENLGSIVFLFKYGDFEALFTGDAEMEVYDEISPDALSDYEIEVLKVPHHGSSDSLNKEFFEKLGPEVSIISVGRNNKYRHPSLSVISFFKANGSTVLRTDEDGTIEVVTDGKGYEVSVER